MKTVIANKADFFPKDGCPIALRTIQGDYPVQHEGDLTDIRHTHDFSELIIITSGGGKHWIDGDTYSVKAGDIFLIQGNTEHYFEDRYKLGMFNIMFTIVFLLVTVTFVVILVKGISEWNKNNHSPRLTVPATIIAKRTNVSRRRHGGANGHHHHHTSTTYYVTFQVESGDRMEFHISGQEYGLLIEGDKGNLSFQGTRYLGFERSI